MRRTILLVLAVAAALAAPAQADTTPKTKPKVPVEGTPPKQLKKTDIKRGTGPLARKGAFVAVKYVGVGWKTKKEFDTSWGRGSAFVFQLGTGTVIPGFDRGVTGMRVGGRRRVDIPASLAYGKRGTPDRSILPNEPLAFVIDLVRVCKSDSACER